MSASPLVDRSSNVPRNEPANPDDPAVANGYDGGGWGGPPPDATPGGSTSGASAMPPSGTAAVTGARGGAAARGAVSTPEGVEVAEVAAVL